MEAGVRAFGALMGTCIACFGRIKDEFSFSLAMENAIFLEPKSSNFRFCAFLQHMPFLPHGSSHLLLEG